MNGDRELQIRVKLIEILLQALERSADPTAKATARELVQTILELHAAGLTRILGFLSEAGDAGQAVIDQCTGDRLVSSLLVLHGIHPQTLETRIRQAMDSARPALTACGCQAEIVSITCGVVRLHLHHGESGFPAVNGQGNLGSSGHGGRARCRDNRDRGNDRAGQRHVLLADGSNNEQHDLMNWQHVKSIADAVLYEGYMLYPYRPSSVKNQHRWTFGLVFPEAFSQAHGGSEACTMKTECLVWGAPHTSLEVKVRFLHLIQNFQPGRKPWQDACEREIWLESGLDQILKKPKRFAFAFPGWRDEQGCREQQSIEGTVELSAESAGDQLFRVSAQVVNATPIEGTALEDRDRAILHALVSTHTILGLRNGELVSLLDPPEQYRAAASACHNVGTWPVLVGEEGVRDTMLSSPIILYDYPRIAPQSPGNLYDSTEIDEILTLRIQTLTGHEKQEAAAVDERTKALLERTEKLSEDQLWGLHGTMRLTAPSATVDFKPGDRVCLRPKQGADGFDVILAGKSATIVSIEQDYEDRVYLSVTVDDDPGKDLGIEGKPGHRFYFRSDEVELVGAVPHAKQPST